MSDTFVGVDIAKAELVVACRPEGVGWTPANGRLRSTHEPVSTLLRRRLGLRRAS